MTAKKAAAPRKRAPAKKKAPEAVPLEPESIPEQAPEPEPVPPPEPAPDAALVSGLLKESLAAHYAAVMARRNRKYAEAHEAVWRALKAREAAHAADPRHKAPAWADERVPHAEMMTFYAQAVPQAAARVAAQ